MLEIGDRGGVEAWGLLSMAKCETAKKRKARRLRGGGEKVHAKAGELGEGGLAMVSRKKAGNGGDHRMADMEQIQGAAFGAGAVAAGKLLGIGVEGGGFGGATNKAAGRDVLVDQSQSGGQLSRKEQATALEEAKGVPQLDLDQGGKG